MMQQSVTLREEDQSYVSAIISEVDGAVKENFVEDSPQRILWDEQKYNSLRDKRQMRWHPLVVRFALNLMCRHQLTKQYVKVG